MQGKGLQDMCKYNVEILLSAAILLTRIQGHLPRCHLSSCPSPSLLLTPSYSSAHSVVTMSITLVTNQLESADYLTDREEPQNLGSNNSSGGQLGRVHVPNTLEDSSWVCCALGDERGWVSDALDESLEVGLEGGNRTTCTLVRLHLYRISQINTYGGVIFWPWKTSLATSSPTRA